MFGISPLRSAKKMSKPYSKFPLIEETRIDGWCFGAVTEFLEDNGCDDGDAFVEAPDGSRAGLVWDVEDDVDPPIQIIADPEGGDHWGLYQIYFSKTVYVMQDMVDNFNQVLPYLKKVYCKVKAGENIEMYRQPKQNKSMDLTE